MSDRDYMKAHETGLEVMGRGTGVPDSLKALADHVEPLTGFDVAGADKLLAVLGTILLRYREHAAELERGAAERNQLRTNVATLRRDRTELDSELAECREALAEWKGRADKAEASLGRLMTELGGLTLSQLPGGAYGGALADAYCDIKAGR